MIRYYRNAAGAYLGAFDRAPSDGIEVAMPPRDARATWQSNAWVEPAPPPALIPLGVLAARIVASGRLTALSQVLDAQPQARARLMTLSEGIFRNDPEARALLVAAGLNPDEVLA